jgi:hypothetical protein
MTSSLITHTTTRCPKVKIKCSEVPNTRATQLSAYKIFCFFSKCTYCFCSEELFFFFFNLPFPFLPYGFYGTFRSAVFLFIFPLSFSIILSFFLGDATGLRGTFPGHPRPFHLTFTDIHNNIYTPMGAFPDRTRTRADLAVVAERVLILPSTTLPSAPRRHTHTSMARRRFLPLKKSSPFGGIRTPSHRDRDLGVLSPTAMRPPSYPAVKSYYIHFLTSIVNI